MTLDDKLGEKVIIYAHGKRYKGRLYSMDEDEIVLVSFKKRTIEYTHIKTDALTSYEGEVIKLEMPVASIGIKFDR